MFTSLSCALRSPWPAWRYYFSLCVVGRIFRNKLHVMIDVRAGVSIVLDDLLVDQVQTVFVVELPTIALCDNRNQCSDFFLVQLESCCSGWRSHWDVIPLCRRLAWEYVIPSRVPSGGLALSLRNSCQFRLWELFTKKVRFSVAGFSKPGTCARLKLT